MSPIARCGCSATACGCVIQALNGNTSVTGKGTVSNPYIVGFDGGNLGITDTSTLNLTLTGNGKAATPYNLRGDVTLALDGLTDVTAPTPTTGYVLGWNGTAWVPVPAATATPGAINVGCGITGDGSAPTPLTAKVDPAGGLVCAAPGLALGSSAQNILSAASVGDLPGYYAKTAGTTNVPPNTIYPTSLTKINLSLAGGDYAANSPIFTTSGGDVYISRGGTYGYSVTFAAPGYSWLGSIRKLVEPVFVSGIAGAAVRMTTYSSEDTGGGSGVFTVAPGGGRLRWQCYWWDNTGAASAAVGLTVRFWSLFK